MKTLKAAENNLRSLVIMYNKTISNLTYVPKFAKLLYLLLKA